MAITTQYSNEYKKVHVDNTGKLAPTDLTGRVRVLWFSFTQDGPGTEGSSFIINRLPSGTVRVLSHMAVFSSLTDPNVAIGWDTYQDREKMPQAADADGLVTNTTVGNGPITVAKTRIFDSIGGVNLRLTSNTPMEDGDTYHGYLLYVID
ncbi:MAG: hypothetical protein LPH21_14800 [Shewanella sp.]|nr:hypothetical protein [Shewanella sp.]